MDSETRDPAALPAIRDSFHELWHAPDSAELTQQLVDAYVPPSVPRMQMWWPCRPRATVHPDVSAAGGVGCAESDAHGWPSKGGLVVMATGLGKTWLAAFDATRPEFRRFCSSRTAKRFCSRHVRYSGRSDRTRRSAW